MENLILVYVTCTDQAQADTIGGALVRERLAACVNMVTGMRSISWWQGRVETADETILIVKTRASLLDLVTARVKALHSYTVPCVVAMPIAGGNADYLGWLAQESGPN